MITACANAGLLSPCICRFGSIELADKFEEAFNLAKEGKLTTPVTSEGTSAPAKAEAPVKKAEAPVKKAESPAKGPEKETTPGKSVFGSGSIFGGASSSPSSGGGIFGTLASGVGGGDKPSGGGIFGTAASGGAFGGSSAGGFGAFGSGAGGGLFGGLKADDSKEKPAAAEKKDEGGDNELVEEEEVTQIDGWTAEVTLEVKDKVDTGEEDEEEMYSQRSKLFRMKDGEWKERGTGLAKLLKHRKTGAVRFLVRQEKTMKIVGNHVVVDKAPYCAIKPLDQSAKFRCWTAQDYAEDEPAVETFALKSRRALTVTTCSRYSILSKWWLCGPRLFQLWVCQCQ